MRRARHIACYWEAFSAKKEGRFGKQRRTLWTEVSQKPLSGAFGI